MRRRIVLPCGGCSCAVVEGRRRRRTAARDAATTGRNSGSSAYLAAVRAHAVLPASRLPVERIQLLERAGVPPEVAARIVSTTRYRA